jgi:hypothetical protein
MLFSSSPWQLEDKSQLRNGLFFDIISCGQLVILISEFVVTGELQIYIKPCYLLMDEHTKNLHNLFWKRYI